MRALSRLFILSTLATVLTFLSGVLGAPVLRVLRSSSSPWLYWPLGILFTGVFWFWGAGMGAALLGSVWLTLGLSVEFESRGWNWWLSGLLSVVAGTLFLATAAWKLLERAGIQNWERFVMLTGEWMDKVHQLNPSVTLDPQLVAQQAPSAGIILVLTALGAGIIFERKVFIWTGLSRRVPAPAVNLLEFRLPDFTIWIALISLLFTVADFGESRVQVVAANVTNIFVVLYFFQGLAVLESFMNFVKAGFFTRVLSYLILVGQLFFVLSAVGLIDYWADFRRRFDRMKLAAENS